MLQHHGGRGWTPRPGSLCGQPWYTLRIREAGEYRFFFKLFYYTVKNTTIPESYFKDSQVDRPYITVQLRKKKINKKPQFRHSRLKSSRVC